MSPRCRPPSGTAAITIARWRSELAALRQDLDRAIAAAKADLARIREGK